jgi:hypothetical protein
MLLSRYDPAVHFVERLRIPFFYGKLSEEDADDILANRSDMNPSAVDDGSYLLREIGDCTLALSVITRSGTTHHIIDLVPDTTTMPALRNNTPNTNANSTISKSGVAVQSQDSYLSLDSGNNIGGLIQNVAGSVTPSTVATAVWKRRDQARGAHGESLGRTTVDAVNAVLREVLPAVTDDETAARLQQQDEFQSLKTQLDLTENMWFYPDLNRYIPHITSISFFTEPTHTRIRSKRVHQ